MGVQALPAVARYWGVYCKRYVLEKGANMNVLCSFLTPSGQGYRSDFWYEQPEHTGTNKLFCIYSEFEDERGTIITESNMSVAEGAVVFR